MQPYLRILLYPHSKGLRKLSVFNVAQSKMILQQFQAVVYVTLPLGSNGLANPMMQVVIFIGKYIMSRLRQATEKLTHAGARPHHVYREQITI